MTPTAPRPPSQSGLSRTAGILTLGWSDRPGPRRRLRRLASRSARLAIRFRSRPANPQGLGQVLVIAPHPDDEAIGCGGLLALLAKAGLAPQVAVVTDGAASHPSHPSVTPVQLAAIRRAECLRSAGILGLPPEALAFLGVADGSLASLAAGPQSAIIDLIGRALVRVQPAVVLLPNRDDGSSEHEASFVLVRAALAKWPGSARILEFPVWAWRHPFRLVRPVGDGRVWRVDIASVLAAKQAALGCYASQVRPIPPDLEPVLPEDFLAEFRRDEEFFFER